MRRTVIFIICMCFLILLPPASFAIDQPRGQELFGKHPGSERDVNPLMEKMNAGNPTVMRSRPAMIHFDAMHGDVGRGGGIPADRLQLSLFPDTAFTAVFDRLEKNPSGSQSWIGHIEGIELSQVILVRHNGLMAGNISMPGAFYQIRHLNKDIHSIRQIDHSKFPESDDAVMPPKSSTIPSPDAGPMKDDGSIVDVMVVYTSSARSVVGGTAAMNTLIDLAITETNASYQNSGVNHRVRLVHRAEVSYTEQSFSADLNNLTGTANGYMDNVHTLRKKYGADEVVLLINNPSSCGLAWLMTTVTTSFAPNAFAVADQSCATGYYSFGHEIGHNMGARHDRYVDNANTPYATSHGYVNTSARWRTIMAYNDKCSDAGFNCTRIQYWSNPNVTYQGGAMGIAAGSASAADNRTTLNNTAFTVANFRDTVVVSTPSSLAINGSSSVEGGSPSSYTATVTYTDGISATVTPTWSVSPTTNATISTSGVLTTTAVTSNQAITITARYTAGGVTVTATKSVTLTVATPTALSISGSSSVNGGASATYTATASLSSGNTATVTPTWSVSPTTNAAISTSGVLTAAAVTSNQTVTITASYTANGVTVSATQNVSILAVPVPTALTISGATAINGGSSTTYSASATISDGTVSTVTANWSVSPTANASISSQGVLTTTSVRALTWLTITASYTSNNVTVSATQSVKINPEALTRLARRTSVISPYWQADSGSYSFISVSHPSLAGMASRIGITATAVGRDGIAQGISDFTVSADSTSKLFIAVTNNPYINPTTIPDQNLIILNDIAVGHLRFTPVASNPETKTSTGGNSDGLRIINMLTIWGAVVNQASSTGFAMEFIGDLADSHNPVRGAIVSAGVN